MPEPLSIAVGVTSLLANSYKFSKDIYELIDGIKSAPNHIRNVSDDLKALYSTLGTLDSLLRDEHISQNTLMRDLSANLEEALKNCVRVFREVGMVISDYVGADGTTSSGVWSKMKWTFKEKEVGALRDHLVTYKATCMMAINTATYVRTIETNNLAQRIQEDSMISSQQTQNTLAFIIRRLEAMETQRLQMIVPVPEKDITVNGGEESEYNYRMKRFMFETASVLSSSPRGSILDLVSIGRATTPSQETSLGDEVEVSDEDSDRQDDAQDDTESIMGGASFVKNSKIIEFAEGPIQRPIIPELSASKYKQNERQGRISRRINAERELLEQVMIPSPRPLKRSPDLVTPVKNDHVTFDEVPIPLSRSPVVGSNRAARNRSKSPADEKQLSRQGRPILKFAHANYAYRAAIPEELSFARGDVLAVLRLQDDGWWEAEVVGKSNRSGLAPSNYLQDHRPNQEYEVAGSSTPGSTPSNSLQDGLPALLLRTDDKKFSARALYTYQAAIPEELSFAKGDILSVLRLQDDGWWEGEVVGKKGITGLAPSNYLEKC